MPIRKWLHNQRSTSLVSHDDRHKGPADNITLGIHMLPFSHAWMTFICMLRRVQASVASLTGNMQHMVGALNSPAWLFGLGLAAFAAMAFTSDEWMVRLHRQKLALRCPSN